MLPPFDSCQVVIIDDDPFQLKMLSHLLTTLGFERSKIQACLGGGEALAQIDAWNRSELLVTLDLNMPDMDGVEVVRQLAERGFAGALVLVSGENTRILETAETLARARSLNVLGHLDKPARRDALETLLGRWKAGVSVVSKKAGKVYSHEEVRRAVTGGELFNVYQPKVSVATAAFQGVETLVRWRHPQDGVVFPDQFIGIAEEDGLIDDLTKVVLAQALDQAKKWQDEGLALRLAVNVSMHNLTRLDFADYVMGEVTRSGFSALQLILEITESLLGKDILAALDILTRLRLKHIGLSIDDFGTGHSSLAQLRDLPFDELKIDRGFVHGAATNATIRGIFEGSLAIAEQLEIEVVAEGVEDLEDWMFLRGRRCHLAQGYFIAKPMPAQDLPAWMADWEKRRSQLAP